MIDRIEHGRVHELSLAKPPANALDLDLIEALLAAVREAPAAGAAALVVSGREGLFSGGLDVPRLLERSRDEMRRLWTSFFELMEALAGSPVPVCAALTGHAPAGGCVLALFCDRRVMAAGGFRIGLNEVGVGLRMPQQILAAAQHVVGVRQAERLACEAELLPGEEALRIGLVDELVPAAEVVPRAVAWGEHMAALPPRALRRTRALARADLLAAFEARDDEQLEAFLDEWFGPETQGAMRALVDALEAKRRERAAADQ